MVSNYNRGRNFEYRVMRDMESHGYYPVRSAGSKSPADIYAFAHDGELVFIQCKLHGSIGVDEWNTFLGFCEHFGAVPIVAEKLIRGIAYHRITGRKDGTKSRQPYEDWTPREVQAWTKN